MPLTRVRREYRGRSLIESHSPGEPFALFRRWLAEALAGRQLEPTAMTLATVDSRGRPRARMVLLKDAGPQGFTFYTNFASAKGRELTQRPDAALVLWWPELAAGADRGPGGGGERANRRLLRSGHATRGSAWASPRESCARLAQALERGSSCCRASWVTHPRPPHWAASASPRSIEFWQGHA
jgi:pyridoxamine 5'-phosphate oxidase